MNYGSYKYGGHTREIERLAVKVNDLKAKEEMRLLRLQYAQYKAAGGTWGIRRWEVMGKPSQPSKWEI